MGVVADAMGAPIDANSLKLQTEALRQAAELKKKEDMAVQMAIAISVNETRQVQNNVENVEQGAVELAMALSASEVPRASTIDDMNKVIKARLEAQKILSVEEKSESSDNEEKLKKKLGKRKDKIKQLKKDLKISEKTVKATQDQNLDLSEKLAVSRDKVRTLEKRNEKLESERNTALESLGLSTRRSRNSRTSFRLRRPPTRRWSLMPQLRFKRRNLEQQKPRINPKNYALSSTLLREPTPKWRQTLPKPSRVCELIWRSNLLRLRLRSTSCRLSSTTVSSC